MKKIGIMVLVLLLGFALAQTQKKVIAAGYACQTKSLFKTMYAIKDSKARDKKLAPNIKNTQCVILKKGDAVEQTGTSFVDDLVKIKYPNKLIGYWTASEFLN
jgi:hypothetical protein